MLKIADDKTVKDALSALADVAARSPETAAEVTFVLLAQAASTMYGINCDRRAVWDEACAAAWRQIGEMYSRPEGAGDA